MTLPTTSESSRLPLPVVLLALSGALVALLGGYWDDAWHTERGRDSFLAAPHIAIYAGVATTGGALALWGLVVARRSGSAAVWRDRPLALALLAVAVTLASGPIDNAWHLAFGRDAVIWSPPHMLGIAGTLALGAALLASLADRPERWSPALGTVAGALVLAAAAFTTVEYDTDVPQFDEAFYLPVLGFCAAIGLALVRAAGGGRWSATLAALTYTAFIAAVGGILALLGFPPPALPLLVVPAIVVDLGLRRPRHPFSLALLFTLALHAVYVPVRNWIGDGVRLDLADVVVGTGLTFVGVALVFSVAAGRADALAMRTPATVGFGTLGLLALALVLAQPAVAHDPGQGEDAGEVSLEVVAAGGAATLRGRLPRDLCGSTEAVAVAARRASETVRGPLRKSGCRLRGRVALPERGRWFVYSELRRDGRAMESWLPVIAGGGPDRSFEPDRYAYFPPERSAGIAKTLGGGLLYGGMLALLYATFLLVRPAAKR